MFEQKLIRRVTGGILGIKLGTKTPKDVLRDLNALQEYNPFMYEELYYKYMDAVQ